MRARTIRGAVGFFLALGAALLVTSYMQSRSGNVYQVIRGGIPSEIYTASWSGAASNVLLVIFSMVGLLWGYQSGENKDKQLHRTPARLPWGGILSWSSC